jgi:branched-chain amino acid transport system ATP-binding protein
MTVLLEAHGLSKHFGGVLALDGLDLTVTPNEILGLIGPNGSGKTTFFNVITGIYRADGGQVMFDGANMTNASSRAVYLAGMSRTFQRSRLSLPLSIFDNIMIGNHKRLNGSIWWRDALSSTSSRKAMQRRARSSRFSSQRWRITCSSRSRACP